MASSVELSEVINSMFRWYRNARVCYAYLSDVPTEAQDNPRASGSRFQHSRWFKRGWTLQELLAPRDLSFYTSDWKLLGTKINMCTAIESITGIPRLILKGVSHLHSASVAQRMSWAAGRKIKRGEDMAYCLLGLFGIAMPMIYGEGAEQAFLRLQEKIMKNTPDHSILAWGLWKGEQSDCGGSNPSRARTTGNVLAATPADFANSGQVVPREQQAISQSFISISCRRVSISIPLLVDDDGGGVIGMLNCGPEDKNDCVIGIPLVDSAITGEYIRSTPRLIILRQPPSNIAPRIIHIKRDAQGEISTSWGFQYENDDFAAMGLKLVDVVPRPCWDKERTVIMATVSPFTKGRPAFIIRLTKGRPAFIIRLRHDEEESRDFIMMPLLYKREGRIEALNHIAICSRDTAMAELQKYVRAWGTKAAGRSSASNGSIHLDVRLEPISGKSSMFDIKPRLMASPPPDTVDITQGLSSTKLAVEMTGVIHNLNQVRDEHGEAHRQTEEAWSALEELRAQQVKVESEIRHLQEKQKDMIEKGRQLSQRLYRLQSETAKAKEKQQRANEELVSKQKQWDGVHQVDYDEYVWEGRAQSGWTPLLWASALGDVDTIKVLLDNGADPAAEDASGLTALGIASSAGHVEVAHLLVSGGAGAVVNKKRASGGDAPLHLAVQNGHEAVVRLLLDHGAEVDIQSDDLFTPIRFAVRRGDVAMVQLLLDKGADITISDKNGGSATEDAIDRRHEAVHRMLARSMLGPEQDTQHEPVMSRAAKAKSTKSRFSVLSWRLPVLATLQKIPTDPCA